jgi:3' terminal RNA ribose 2'-O-methyltransferase Hen1
MFLTISTTHQPATDLGFLLHKHPDRMHSAELSFGTARVFYPDASADRCTVALLVEVDPVALIRGNHDSARTAVTLGHYVNDRPYAASSFLASAIGKVFGTAMTGRSKDRPELAATPIPLEIHIPSLPCRGGETVLRRIFEPLGYQLRVTSLPLDPTKANWGMSRYFDVTLIAVLQIRQVLEHLHVLIPVLDDSKHYWVGDEEIERLLRRGGAWLATHPDRDLITTRSLRHNKRLSREALARLSALDSGGADLDVDALDEQLNDEEQIAEERLSLNDQRLSAVIRAVQDSGARRIADLGCGEGRLIARLLREVASVEKVIGVDVSMRSLQRAARKLNLDSMSPSTRKRVDLFQGALTYRDRRLVGVDAITLVEVIEHIDYSRLDALQRVVFDHLAPRTIVVTTPNIEYNARFPGIPTGRFRHGDHRFEWTRTQFAAWAMGICEEYSYVVVFEPIGQLDDEFGAPTQMAIFTRVRTGV